VVFTKQGRYREKCGVLKNEKRSAENNSFFGKAFFFKERFIGTIIGMLLGFVGRVILVRFTTQIEYGIYCLALVIISIFVIISTLGLSEGSTRYITYFHFTGRKKVL
jgi:hypothetical protein